MFKCLNSRPIVGGPKCPTRKLSELISEIKRYLSSKTDLNDSGKH